MRNQFTSLSEIRKVFLDYFEKNGHTVFPSGSLVPDRDPTLLFTNAGMVPFKDYFTGKAEAPFKRITTAQKCVRAGGKHNDLENVGYTARHHTFFEMLGNFSFGDYFKEQAIYHAWTVVTQELGLSPEHLCVTIFADDDQAFSIWKKITSFPDSKIIRIATADNFWSMGETGPCGPCSEIFFDRGESVAGGPPGSANQDGDRFTEIWNLVFMQYEQKANGERLLLPKPCIDTGMGLERVASILQNKKSNFEIDLFQSLISDIREKSGCFSSCDQSCQVIADHLRASCFLIADGIQPLNEGRGYVLRRIIRRAVRHARLLGMMDPILYRLVDRLVDLMSDPYEELVRHRSLIQSVLFDEEKRFGATLELGLKLVDESVTQLSGKILPGDVAFKLYDTYGFPLDLTADILKSKGLTVDFSGFEIAMQKQKEMSKKSDTLGIKVSQKSSLSGSILELNHIQKTEKKCYETLLVQEAKILFLEKKEDNRVTVVLDQSPFFAESGGQVGDCGTLSNGQGLLLEVMNTQSVEHASWVLHDCQVISGNPKVNDVVEAKVNFNRRQRISAHHSATHILQASMRKILGDHVTQRGSLVDANRLRFDFTHSKELSVEEKGQVECLVNSVILSAAPTQIRVCSKDEAISSGALAFFDEKYGLEVRVVQIGADEKNSCFSKELCGGTHVKNTGEIGLFKILNESGIASGVRRIEAVCGYALREWVDETMALSAQEKSKLKEEERRLQKRITQLETELAMGKAKVSVEMCGDLSVTTHWMGSLAASQMREVADLLAKCFQSGVLIVAGAEGDQAMIIVCIGPQTVGDMSAREIVQEVCQTFNGRGGGKKNLAQCGGIARSDLEKAVEVVKNFIRKEHSDVL